MTARERPFRDRVSDSLRTGAWLSLAWRLESRDRYFAVNAGRSRYVGRPPRARETRKAVLDVGSLVTRWSGTDCVKAKCQWRTKVSSYTTSLYTLRLKTSLKWLAVVGCVPVPFRIQKLAGNSNCTHLSDGGAAVVGRGDYMRDHQRAPWYTPPTVTTGLSMWKVFWSATDVGFVSKLSKSSNSPLTPESFSDILSGNCSLPALHFRTACTPSTTPA